MVNKAAYEKLVNEDCKKYHLDKGEESDLFEWCPDCREINLWTYWQGKDAKDVKIMVVGQDWGNYHLPKNTQTMENIREHRNYFCNQDTENSTVYQTDKSLCVLFESIGYKDIINNRYDDLFFTNFFLKYRAEGCKETGGMSRTNMMRDAASFSALVDATRPKVIICLGMLTYECVIDALRPGEKCRIGKITDYCDLIDNHKNYTDIAGVRVFGMVHCGASGVNVIRKKGTRTDKNKKGIELMIQDWKEIKKYLEDKDIFLNLKPVN